MRPLSVEDLAKRARKRLPRFLFEYIDGGSCSEYTLNRNVDDLRRVELRQRVLQDVSHVDLVTSLFGEHWALPIALGPVGISGMFATRGEVQAAAAAEQAGIPFCLSTLSVCSIEELRSSLRQPFWFQMYMIRDRAFVEDLLDRARAASCPVLLLTVDMPVAGIRYRDFRSGMSGSPGLRVSLCRLIQSLRKPRWLYEVGLGGRPHAFGNLRPVLGKRSGLNDAVDWIARNFDASVSWRDLEWLRARWHGKIVLKGVLDVEDAREAAAAGVDGIVVSNHGGRQLDGARSTARALPAIAECVGDRMTVLADGGVRSGVDVARMLALGARAVLLGRAWAYALAAGGRAGVEALITTFSVELATTMALAGCTGIAQLGPSVLDIGG